MGEMDLDSFAPTCIAAASAHDFAAAAGAAPAVEDCYKHIERDETTMRRHEAILDETIFAKLQRCCIVNQPQTNIA